MCASVPSVLHVRPRVCLEGFCLQRSLPRRPCRMLPWQLVPTVLWSAMPSCSQLVITSIIVQGVSQSQQAYLIRQGGPRCLQRLNLQSLCASCTAPGSAMGRKDSKHARLRVNARKFVAGQQGDTSCTRETVALLTCLQRHAFDESAGQCAEEYAALAECSHAARLAVAARKGHMPSINFHLSRIAKLMHR